MGIEHGVGSVLYNKWGRMKKYRKENNMTQKDLADIFEVRHSLVSRWENGQRYPTTKHIEKIKSILKIGE